MIREYPQQGQAWQKNCVMLEVLFGIDWKSVAHLRMAAHHEHRRCRAVLLNGAKVRKVLFIFGQLKDTDVDWLARHGRRQSLAAGSVLIDTSSPIDALYIVLEGHLAVLQRKTNVRIARLAAGELVGEMSFVEARLPSATVIAESDVVVFSIAKAALQAHLDENEGFAARFYKAVAVFLSDRLRKASAGQGETDDDADELDELVLDNVDRAGACFALFSRQLFDT